MAELNRRSFLTATLGAAVAASVDDRRVGSTWQEPPVALEVLCRKWFLGEVETGEIEKAVDAIFARDWASLPSINDLEFRRVILSRPELQWVRVCSPRFTFDIYESNVSREDISRPAPIKPFYAPSACLPVSYYMRNGPAPDRLAYAVRTAIHDITQHAMAWYHGNPEYHDIAVFVRPNYVLRQESFLLETWCNYHVFSCLGETAVSLIDAVKNFKGA